jgi:hypothetical protein
MKAYPTRLPLFSDAGLASVTPGLLRRLAPTTARCASPRAPTPEDAEGKALFFPAPDQIIRHRRPLAESDTDGGLFCRGVDP